ncbi:MAG: hypothetical protein LBF22_04740 [Deltaproteobacteria bacterium]|jgi:hypothetical protein|nr:hypothetical protein [Deltaproteobacteria bacterium]
MKNWKAFLISRRSGDIFCTGILPIPEERLGTQKKLEDIGDSFLLYGSGNVTYDIDAISVNYAYGQANFWRAMRQ